MEIAGFPFFLLLSLEHFFNISTLQTVELMNRLFLER